MINHFYSQMLLWTADKLKGLYIRNYYNNFRKLQWLDKESIQAYQDAKLKTLLIHAYENIPFYSLRFKEHDIDVYNESPRACLSRIPPLTREDLQVNFDHLKDIKNSYKRISKGSSSGSTGQKVFYLHDEFGSSAGKASQLIGWEMMGYRFLDKGLHIWGNPAIVKNDWVKTSSKLKSKIFRHHKFPAYLLTEKSKFDELIDKIIREKYVFIDGYTNAIYLLAKYIENNNIAFPLLKYVITTGENLHDYQKKTIERVLGPVYDEYGCGEINGIAYNNKFNNLYTIIDTHVIVKYDLNVISNDGSYPLLVTDLDNKIMPFINYKNGDLGTPGQVNTQNTVPMIHSMTSVNGRLSDIVEIPGGGNLVVPSFFGSVLLKEIESISQYQIIKIASNKLELNFVVDGALSVSDKSKINKAMDDYLGKKMEYEIRVVDRIEVGTNGKYKLLIDKSN